MLLLLVKQEIKFAENHMGTLSLWDLPSSITIHSVSCIERQTLTLRAVNAVETMECQNVGL